MDLFPSDHTDIEGATIINACYGGTAALLNALAWCDSSDCCPDHDDDNNHDDNDNTTAQYAIVVAADIATYARGPARPTCGVGAVAMLLGRDAPLAYDGPRTTHACAA